jgi:hypothetical protein
MSEIKNYFVSKSRQKIEKISLSLSLSISLVYSYKFTKYTCANVEGNLHTILNFLFLIIFFDQIHTNRKGNKAYKREMKRIEKN